MLGIRLALLLLAPLPDEIDRSYRPSLLSRRCLRFEWLILSSIYSMIALLGDYALMWRIPRMFGCELVSEMFDGVFSY
jgi:hypothetical protein